MDEMKEKKTEAEAEDMSPYTDELNAEEQHLQAWVQMNHCRHQAAKPDVDQAWADFCRKNLSEIPAKRTFSLWHLTLAALTGAAAVLAVIFFVDKDLLLFGQDKEPLVALQYEESTREVSLEQEGAKLALASQDSVSFVRVTEAPLVAEVKQQRLSTPRGMDFKVELPDGSEVWLNAESTIEFPSAFLSGTRQVKLQGEAYFKVKHDEESPFIVTSNQMSVRVLGTEFNFKSYATETAYVALVNGKVEVMRPDTTLPEATLEPGEAAWFDEQGEVQKEEIDPYVVTQWVNGFFYFHDEPLVEVLRELGRWYNIGVVFRNKDAVHHKVHFSALRNEDVALAIESLNRLRRFQIRLEGNDMVVY